MSLPDITESASAPEVNPGAGSAARQSPEERTKHKLITGIVTSDKMQKTRSVQVIRLEKHPKYGKYVRRQTTYKVHDEKEISREGDTVLIAETRPLSKTKRWRLMKVVTKAKHGKIVVPAGKEEELSP